LLKQGKRKFFFLTVDYAFGHAMQREATKVIEEYGGTVVGSVLHPYGATDYASYMVQAQASGAEVLAFATSGTDFQNALKQAAEFGLAESGMTLLGLNPHITDVHGVGLQVAQGLLVADAWNWDVDEPSRAFAARFLERAHVMPTALITSEYSAVRHYLQAVEKAGTKDAKTVMKTMQEMPVDDFYADGGTLRPDGRMVHRWLYLFKVKTPAESKGPWDLYDVVAKVPGKDYFRPMSNGGCPLTQ
jgi:branched-chain amino acid transport system substrate-binding protein